MVDEICFHSLIPRRHATILFPLLPLFQIYTRQSNLEFFAKIKKGDAARAKVYWPSTNLF